MLTSTAPATSSLPEDAAPALSRGLTLLAYLNREGASSLDRLAKATGFPKASLLRMLRTMESSGAVAREGLGKRWHSLIRLEPGTPRERLLRERCALAASWLCRSLRHTVEIYAFEGARLTMIDRADPEGETPPVRRRIGHVALWDECDAVVQVGLAFGFTESWPTQRHWRWESGARVSVAREQVAETVAQARRARRSADGTANANGTRRYAAALLDEVDTLVGVISVARSYAPVPDASDERFLNHVTAAARRIGPLPVEGR